MKKSPEKPELSNKEIRELIKSLNQFASWLVKKKIIDELPNIGNTIDLPSSNEDWTMRYDEQARTISFNTILRRKCSFGYFQSIVIHEFFHLAVQKVPNKDEAIKIKDDFGGELMKLIDIEADFFTAMFYKEVLGYSLVQFLAIFYEGSQVFNDKWVRRGKLERYMGTLLSITKLYLKFPNKTSVVNSYDIYLPSISPMYTEENLHVLVLRKEHIYFEQINATIFDITPMKECYNNTDTLTLKGYIKGILGFTSKALGLIVSKKIETEIETIKH